MPALSLRPTCRKQDCTGVGLRPLIGRPRGLNGRHTPAVLISSQLPLSAERSQRLS